MRNTFVENPVFECQVFLLRFYTVGSDGSTTLAFNATSIQNAVILGLFTLVLGALVLPLFGLSLGSLFGAESTGSGYGSQYGHSEPSYGSGHRIKDIYVEKIPLRGISWMTFLSSVRWRPICRVCSKERS